MILIVSHGHKSWQLMYSSLKKLCYTSNVAKGGFLFELRGVNQASFLQHG
jgi:hypothetical protein